MEHVKQVGQIIYKFEEALPELEELQGTMAEKRDQLEKLKVKTIPTKFNFTTHLELNIFISQQVNELLVKYWCIFKFISLNI